MTAVTNHDAILFRMLSAGLMVAVLAIGPVPAAASAAQPPLVEIVDLNPEQGEGLIAAPIAGAYWNGRVYFEGRLDDGDEVFVADDTLGGTSQFIDLWPGERGSRPDQFTRVGGSESTNTRVFFAAETADAGRELWVTAGAPASTALVADFLPGDEGSDPDSLTAWDGALYLTVSAGAGRQLYQVNRGTLLATPLGAGSFELARGAELVGTDTALYFPATSTVTGDIEIWSTDGSSVTRETGTGCDDIGDAHVAGGLVFFVCSRAGSVDVLQVDPGQPDGTTTIQAHAGASDVAELASAGGLLYWSLDGEQLWAWDPAAPLVGIAATYAAGADIGGLARLGSRLLFRADSGSGLEPHVADGFSAAQLRDVFPGPEDGMDTFAGFAVHDGLAYFRADDGVAGDELWRTDGTGMGTVLFQDIEPGGDRSRPASLLDSPFGLLFTLNDGGLWATDGTGVVRLDDLQRSSSSPGELFYDAIGDRLFFTAFWTGFGEEPWVSDGTEAGSYRLRDIRVGELSSRTHELLAAFPSTAGAQPSRFLFAADDGVNDQQLWQSDGTPAGTLPFATLNPGGDARVIPGTHLDAGYYFAADDGVTGRELWRTDGTSGGTQRLTDLDIAGNSIITGAEFATFDGQLFFEADDGISGRELWRTDGTGAPSLLADLAPGPDSATPSDLRPTPSRLFFVADDGNERYLWRSDGTAQGTQAVLQTDAPGLTAVGDAVYFRHDDGAAGEELWRADATSVAQVVDLTPGPTGSIIRIAGAINGRIVFTNGEATFDGIRLYASDGTPGTAQSLGAFKSVASSQAVAFDGHLYFPAEIDGEGQELWRTDGTSVEMIDLEPGPTPSTPDDFTVGSDRLFFFAYDRTVKNELHVLSRNPVLFADGFEPVSGQP
jgi:ELWxxDGT repeat protein